MLAILFKILLTVKPTILARFSDTFLETQTGAGQLLQLQM